MMDSSQIRNLIQIGHALWPDFLESHAATAETLSAVSFMDLTEERRLERAAEALLDRVVRKGIAADTAANLALSHLDTGAARSFYRLMPEERFLLVALHLARWSYSRMGRILGVEPSVVEQRAWDARLRFASAAGLKIYPAGASQLGASCPSYDARKPWTQRFLDEEISSGRERLFLQNHLMACASCREALGRCRELYYALDRGLPRGEESLLSRSVAHLALISRESQGLRSPSDRSFRESLEVFTRRSNVRIALAILLFVVVVLGVRALTGSSGS